MTGYRFRTEEEMILAYGPDWKNLSPIQWGSLDLKVLGLPLSIDFFRYLLDNMKPVEITNKGKHIAIMPGDINKYTSVFFDIKDTSINKQLSKEVRDFEWDPNKNIIGHPILYDWLVPYYIDSEGWVKRSIEGAKKIVVRIPS